jgi:hypothetical protein
MIPQDFIVSSRIFENWFGLFLKNEFHAETEDKFIRIFVSFLMRPLSEFKLSSLVLDTLFDAVDDLGGVGRPRPIFDFEGLRPLKIAYPPRFSALIFKAFLILIFESED